MNLQTTIMSTTTKPSTLVSNLLLVAATASITFLATRYVTTKKVLTTVTTNSPTVIDFVQPTKDNGNDTTVLLPHQHEARMEQKVKMRESIASENAVARNLVTVRVPATSANLGPGFDCLGAAVDLWSTVTVERADKFEIIATGEGADVMPKDASNYVVIGLEAAFKAAGKTVPNLKYVERAKREERDGGGRGGTPCPNAQFSVCCSDAPCSALCGAGRCENAVSERSIQCGLLRRSRIRTLWRQSLWLTLASLVQVHH